MSTDFDNNYLIVIISWWGFVVIVLTQQYIINTGEGHCSRWVVVDKQDISCSMAMINEVWVYAIIIGRI